MGMVLWPGLRSITSWPSNWFHGVSQQCPVQDWWGNSQASPGQRQQQTHQHWVSLSGYWSSTTIPSHFGGLIILRYVFTSLNPKAFEKWILPRRGCLGWMGVLTGRNSEEGPGSSTARQRLRTGSASRGGTDWRRPANRTHPPCWPRRFGDFLKWGQPQLSSISRRDCPRNKPTILE